MYFSESYFNLISLQSWWNIENIPRARKLKNIQLVEAYIYIVVRNMRYYFTRNNSRLRTVLRVIKPSLIEGVFLAEIATWTEERLPVEKSDCSQGCERLRIFHGTSSPRDSVYRAHDRRVCSSIQTVFSRERKRERISLEMAQPGVIEAIGEPIISLSPAEEGKLAERQYYL